MYFELKIFDKKNRLYYLEDFDDEPCWHKRIDDKNNHYFISYNGRISIFYPS